MITRLHEQIHEETNPRALRSIRLELRQEFVDYKKLKNFLGACRYRLRWLKRQK